MKKIIAILLTLCFVLVPITVFAEGTDYSYLEDMSIKELKELRDEINKLLGDNGSIEEIEEELTEEELTEEEELAITVIDELANSLKNPHSLKLYHVYADIYKMTASDTTDYGVWVEYSATNGYGAEVENIIQFSILLPRPEYKTVKEAIDYYKHLGSSLLKEENSIPDYVTGEFGTHEELDADKILKEVMKKR